MAGVAFFGLAEEAEEGLVFGGWGVARDDGGELGEEEMTSSCQAPFCGSARRSWSREAAQVPWSWEMDSGLGGVRLIWVAVVRPS